MKRLLAILLILVMLTGCAPAVPPATDSNTTPTTEPQPTREPTEPGPDLLDGMEPIAPGSGLYRIRSAAFRENCMVNTVLIFGGDLLLGGYDGVISPEFAEGDVSYRLVLLDIQSGEVKADASFLTADGFGIQICGNQIALNDMAKGQVILLDSRLHRQKTYQVAEEWAVSYLDSAASCAYRVTPELELVRTQLESGEETVVLGKALSMYISAYTGDGFTVDYLDAATQRYERCYLDLTTGKLRKLPFTMESGIAALDGAGDYWLAASSGVNAPYLFGTEDKFGFFNPDGMTFSLIDGPSPLMGIHFTAEGAQEAFLYAPNGSLRAKCSYQSDRGSFGTPVWSSRRKGYFIPVSTMSGQPEVLFWDPQTTASGKNLAIRDEEFPRKEPGEPAVSQALYDRAEAISKKYGVQILIADRCRTDFNDFGATLITDEWMICQGLDVLEQALAAYPRGFMQQLIYGSYEATKIYLVGSVFSKNIPPDANGFTSFAAFVTNDAPDHRMVLDITLPDLKQTIFHEFSHIIDDKLEFYSRFHQGIYSENAWAALNPPKFRYVNDLYHMPDSYEDDGYSGYFIDLYARTYPTEDRARVLEFAMTGFEDYFIGRHCRPLREKLAFYSAAIRECFDTAGWPEETLWEKPLRGYRYQEDKPRAA